MSFKGTDCINGTLFERSLMPRKVNYTRILQIFSSKEGYDNRYDILNILGRGGVQGQGKGSGSWVKKRLMGILAVNGYGSV